MVFQPVICEPNFTRKLALSHLVLLSPLLNICHSPPQDLCETAGVKHMETEISRPPFIKIPSGKLTVCY